MPRLSPGQTGEHLTFCRICEAMCGMTATVEDGRIVRLGPDREHPVSEGHVCVKGTGMLHVTYDPDRVLLASADPAHWEQVSGACFVDGFPVTVTRAGGPATPPPSRAPARPGAP